MCVWLLTTISDRTAPATTSSSAAWGDWTRRSRAWSATSTSMWSRYRASRRTRRSPCRPPSSRCPSFVPFPINVLRNGRDDDAVWKSERVARRPRNGRTGRLQLVSIITNAASASNIFFFIHVSFFINLTTSLLVTVQPIFIRFRFISRS